MGRKRGHPWGETVATSGAFQWPPMGSFPWPPSTGHETVMSAAARSGSYGLNLSETGAQSEKAVKTLRVPLTDSTTEFWMRVDSASGIAVVAEGRDLAGTGYEWVLKCDSAHQQFCFYPYNGATSTDIFTGVGTAPLNTWLKVDIVYNATSAGGA